MGKGWGSLWARCVVVGLWSIGLALGGVVAAVFESCWCLRFVGIVAFFWGWGGVSRTRIDRWIGYGEVG